MQIFFGVLADANAAAVNACLTRADEITLASRIYDEENVAVLCEKAVYAATDAELAAWIARVEDAMGSQPVIDAVTKLHEVAQAWYLDPVATPETAVDGCVTRVAEEAISFDEEKVAARCTEVVDIEFNEAIMDAVVEVAMISQSVIDAVGKAKDASRTLNQAPDAELLEAVLAAKEAAVDACKTRASEAIYDEEAVAGRCVKEAGVAAEID